MKVFGKGRVINQSVHILQGLFEYEKCYPIRPPLFAPLFRPALNFHLIPFSRDVFLTFMFYIIRTI